MLSASDDERKKMEDLHLVHYVNGWGDELDSKFVKSLGLEKSREFTIHEAEAYAKPLIEAKAKACAEREAKKKSSDAAKFLEAKQTGKPVVLKQWSEECNDPSEECNVDNLTMVAMPDGTTKTTRNHTW